MVLLKKAHRKGFRGCIHSTFAPPKIEQFEQASILPRGKLDIARMSRYEVVLLGGIGE